MQAQALKAESEQRALQQRVGELEVQLGAEAELAKALQHRLNAEGGALRERTHALAALTQQQKELGRQHVELGEAHLLLEAEHHAQRSAKAALEEEKRLAEKRERRQTTDLVALQGRWRSECSQVCGPGTCGARLRPRGRRPCARRPNEPEP